jgi:ryanodine receptor 2
MSNYHPNPIDTSNIELGQDVLDLAELIAENTHDVWASGRISQGWTYGEKRDDIKKETPCLVPYADLPESEKEYDRSTALETLRLMIKLGYKISKE